MPLSPICLVNSGPTANGVDVAPNSVVSVTLLDPTSPGMQWFLEVIGTDELTTVPTLTNVNVLTHQVVSPGSTVTFVFPNSSGRAIGFKSRVTGIGGPIETTFGVYSLTDFSTRVGFVLETREGDLNFGWATKVNPLIRSGGGGGGANNYSLTAVADSQVIPTGQQMIVMDDVQIDDPGDLVVDGDVTTFRDDDNFSVLYVPLNTERVVQENDEMLYTDDLVVDGQLTVDGQVVDATPYDGNDILAALTAIAPNTPSILGVNSPVGFLTPAQARTVMDVPSNPELAANLNSRGLPVIDSVIRHADFSATVNTTHYVWTNDGSPKTVTLPAAPADGDRVEIIGFGFGDDHITINNAVHDVQYGAGSTSVAGNPWEFFGSGLRLLLVFRSAIATGSSALWMSVGDGVNQKFGAATGSLNPGILIATTNLKVPTFIPIGSHSFVTRSGVGDIDYRQLPSGDAIPGRQGGSDIQEIAVSQGEIVSFPFGAAQLGSYTIGRLRPYKGSVISSPGSYGLSTGYINLYQGYGGSGIILILPPGNEGDEIDVREINSGLEIGTHDLVTIQCSGGDTLETLAPSGLIVTATSDKLNQFGLHVRYKFYSAFGTWKIVNKVSPGKGVGPLITGTATLRSGAINPYSGSPTLYLPNNPKDGDEVDLMEASGTTSSATLTTSGGSTNIQTLGGTVATSLSLIDRYLRVVYRWDNTNSIWRLVSGPSPKRVTYNQTTSTTPGVNTLCKQSTSGGPVGVTLPTGAAAGDSIIVKMTSTATNNITITRGGSDTIDGSTTLLLTTDYECVTLVSDGAGSWMQTA